MTVDVRLGEVPDPAPQARHRLPEPVPPAPGPPGTVAPDPVDTRWEPRYRRRVIASDVVSVAVVVPIGHVLGLGTQAPNLGGNVSPWLGAFSALLAVCCLSLSRTWDLQILGQGSEEFSRLVRAMVNAAVVLGLIGLALEVGAVRPWVFGLIPLMGALSLLGRYLLRRRLHRQRALGRSVHSGLAVGSVESVTDLIVRTRREPFNGWVVREVCTPGGTGPDGAPHILGVPVVGDLDAVADTVRRGGHRIVSIGRGPGWTPGRMHRLAWDLEGLGADLFVDPGLMEFAGPRLHVTPVDGLPLLRLTQPALDGIPRVVKATFDRIGAVLLLVVTAPVLLGVAIAVRSDGGPVFFRQTRVGRHGRTFRMIKFRSMIGDAERLRADLVARNESDGPLFKIRQDPRITPVGAWLRKYSVDELPQLFNVVAGTMSLVGPRPPLPEEVATYGREAERKLRVRPGLTGLWQISGRSNLSWEESVRLDLRYVENWTLALDAVILWKTIGAIARGDGAY
jgi:exopolysaccharide biosynthesis polyprenyl glycosylphosphotransferase